MSIDSLNSVSILTPFVVLDYLPSSKSIEAFLILIQYTHWLLFLQTFLSFCHNSLLDRIKNLWIFWTVTYIKQMLVLKKLFVSIFWFYVISKTVCVSKQQFSINFFFFLNCNGSHTSTNPNPNPNPSFCQRFYE